MTTTFDLVTKLHKNVATRSQATRGPLCYSEAERKEEAKKRLEDLCQHGFNLHLVRGISRPAWEGNHIADIGDASCKHNKAFKPEAKA